MDTFTIDFLSAFLTSKIKSFKLSFFVFLVFVFLSICLFFFVFTLYSTLRCWNFYYLKYTSPPPGGQTLQVGAVRGRQQSWKRKMGVTLSSPLSNLSASPQQQWSLIPAVPVDFRHLLFFSPSGPASWSGLIHLSQLPRAPPPNFWV